MRQLGSIHDERAARRLQDYLLTKGITVSVEPDGGGWKIWVRDEDRLEAARREFAEFSANPDAPVYTEAARLAESLRTEQQRLAQLAKKNYVNVGRRWRSGAHGRAPVTSLLMAISIVVAIYTNLGKNENTQKLMFDVATYYLGPHDEIHSHLEYVWRYEPWRLVTPIFLHFNIMHIVFNMMMLLQLGRVIEMLRGSWRFGLLVLLIAIPSNIAQYYWQHGPGFGGMSGVVYGLFGYVWMKSRYEPQSGFFVTQSTVMIMIGFFVLCLTGWIGQIANAAHGAGLLVGMILGRARSAMHLLR